MRNIAGSVALPAGELATIRPVAADDGQAMREFIRGLSPSSRYFRFMMGVRELSDEALQRFTHPRRDSEAVLVAVVPDAGVIDRIIGMAQYVADDDGRSCEFALVVDDAWQRRGLGYRLLAELSDVAMRAGLSSIHADVLADNHSMRRLAEKTGCELRHNPAAPFVLRLSRSFPGHKASGGISPPRGRQSPGLRAVR